MSKSSYETWVILTILDPIAASKLLDNLSSAEILAALMYSGALLTIGSSITPMNSLDIPPPEVIMPSIESTKISAVTATNCVNV